MRLQDGDRERLKALVNGIVWAPMGTGASGDNPKVVENEPSESSETPADAGVSGDSWGETRTPDLTIMSRAL